MSSDYPNGTNDARSSRKPDASTSRSYEQSKGGGSPRPSFNKRRPEPASLIIGWHPIMEALDAGKEFQRVMIQRDEKNEKTASLLLRLRELEIPVQRVPREKMDRVTSKNHQGLVAFLSPIIFQPLEELIARAYEKGESPLFVALDGVTDVRNLGAIARTAECFGAAALVIPSFGVAPIQEDAIKSSSGALLRIPVTRTPRMSDALQTLTQHGIRCIALTEKSASPIQEIPLHRPLCLVLGDEEKGISMESLQKCEAQAKLHMVGKTGSLNVSVAAGIALSHIAMFIDGE